MCASAHRRTQRCRRSARQAQGSRSQSVEEQRAYNGQRTVSSIWLGRQRVGAATQYGGTSRHWDGFALTAHFPHADSGLAHGTHTRQARAMLSKCGERTILACAHAARPLPAVTGFQVTGALIMISGQGVEHMQCTRTRTRSLATPTWNQRYKRRDARQQRVCPSRSKHSATQVRLRDLPGVALGNRTSLFSASKKKITAGRARGPRLDPHFLPSL